MVVVPRPQTRIRQSEAGVRRARRVRSTLRLEMAWQYRPRSPEGESANTLHEYQIRLRAAELRDQQEVNLDTEPRAAGRFNTKRLRNVALLWTVVALVIAGVATWFFDQVVP